MFFKGTAAVALLAAVALAGCGGGGRSSTGGGNAPAARGGTLKIATAHDITSFDETKIVDNESIRAISQINEGLFKTDASGHLVPWLATGDQVSSDGLTHTLSIRPGITFSNGKPLTAKDVAFTLQTSKKSAQWGFALADVVKISTPDDHTVVLELKQPSAALHAELALFANGIVPDNFGGKSESGFAQHPIGTGPFVLARWDKGTRVVLARNPRYWRKGEPILDRVELIGVPDDNSRITQLRGHQVDVAANPPWPQIDTLNRTPGLKVGVYALARVDTLGLNASKAPFTDIRVRKAVSLALDRAAIVKASLSNRGKPGSSFLAPSIPFYSSTPVPSGPGAVAQAKQLVAQAGATGKTIQLLLFAGDSVGATIGQIVQQELGAIGLHVKLLPLDQSAALQRSQNGDYTAAVSYLTSDIVDPSELAAFFVGTKGFFTFANPPSLAKVAAQASRETDTAKRAQLYATFQRDVVQQYAFIPVQVEPWTWGVSDRVRNFAVNATGIFDLATVSVAAGT